MALSPDDLRPIRPSTFSSPFERHTEQPRVLCVYGSKGGVGKTTIAANLAARMSHHLGLQVLVIDLDVSFGDLGSRLHRYEPTALEALAEPALSPASLRPWLHHEPTSGFWALLAPIRPPVPSQRRLLSPLAYRRLLAASTDFDVVVLDCPVELTDPLVCRFALRVAEAICFVVNNERATLVDARRALAKMTNDRDAPFPGLGIAAAKVKVLVNQHVADIGVVVDDISHALNGFPIVATLPDDRPAHLGAANAANFVAVAERCAVTTALDAAVDALLPQLTPVPGSAAVDSAAKLARLQHDLERVRWPRLRRVFRRT